MENEGTHFLKGNTFMNSDRCREQELFTRYRLAAPDSSKYCPASPEAMLPDNRRWVPCGIKKKHLPKPEVTFFIVQQLKFFFIYKLKKFFYFLLIVIPMTTKFVSFLVPCSQMMTSYVNIVVECVYYCTNEFPLFMLSFLILIMLQGSSGNMLFQSLFFQFDM